MLRVAGTRRGRYAYGPVTGLAETTVGKLTGRLWTEGKSRGWIVLHQGRGHLRADPPMRALGWVAARADSSKSVPADHRKRPLRSRPDPAISPANCRDSGVAGIHPDSELALDLPPERRFRHPALRDVDRELLPRFPAIECGMAHSPSWDRPRRQALPKVDIG